MHGTSENMNFTKSLTTIVEFVYLSAHGVLGQRKKWTDVALGLGRVVRFRKCCGLPITSRGADRVRDPGHDDELHRAVADWWYLSYESIVPDTKTHLGAFVG